MFYKGKCQNEAAGTQIIRNSAFITTTYLNPEMAFWYMVASLLLSNTKLRAATVGPQMRENRS
jgi:hypothetical protein